MKVPISSLNLRNIEYVVQEAFVGIQRNGLMAFATITTIALSMAVLGAFVLGAIGANNFTSSQIGEFEIAAFMKNQSTFSGTSKIAQQIEKINGVKSVTIKSRDKEWEQFKLEHPDIEAAGLPLNVLPYSMNIKVSNPSLTNIIAAKIRIMPAIDAVKEGKDVLNRVMGIAKLIKLVSYIGVIILLITIIFIINNAIRLTLYARRQEIRIMQLVGATDQFIKIPLIIEGIVFGIIGSTFAWILLRLGSAYIYYEVNRIMPLLLSWNSHINPFELLFGLAITGAIIGAAGSFVSMRKFLHN